MSYKLQASLIQSFIIDSEGSPELFMDLASFVELSKSLETPLPISCQWAPLIFPIFVATLLWVKWEDETPTPKVGDLESSRTPECLEFKNKDQNTLHWGVLGVIGNILKFRCLKWPRIGHLDICSPSYEQKKGRESNWQFDSRPLKVGNRPLPDIRIGRATWRWKAVEESYNFGSDLALIRLGSHQIRAPKVPGLQPG